MQTVGINPLLSLFCCCWQQHSQGCSQPGGPPCRGSQIPFPHSLCVPVRLRQNHGIDPSTAMRGHEVPWPIQSWVGMTPKAPWLFSGMRRELLRWRSITWGAWRAVLPQIRDRFSGRQCNCLIFSVYLLHILYRFQFMNYTYASLNVFIKKAVCVQLLNRFPTVFAMVKLFAAVADLGWPAAAGSVPPAPPLLPALLHAVAMGQKFVFHSPAPTRASSGWAASSPTALISDTADGQCHSMYLLISSSSLDKRSPVAFEGRNNVGSSCHSASQAYGKFYLGVAFHHVSIWLFYFHF